SNVIDINSSYNLNSNLPLIGFEAIVDTFNLKQAENVLSFEETSKYYWDNIEQDEKNTMKKINLQLGNQINTNIQFVNKFRTI
ncbi:MAG: hypothetical protein PF487_13705, partial [Bacteroidales bacterium]|nr:hypothetical protein [Bacteroidales bacterium]